MKLLRAMLLSALLCAGGAWAGEEEERIYAEVVEQFEQLHDLMIEVAERGGVQEDVPLARQLRDRYQGLKEFLVREVTAREDDIPHSQMEKLHEAGEHLEQLMQEFGARSGKVDAAHIQATGEAFHQLMAHVAEAIGVEHHAHEEPDAFDVTAVLHFHIGEAAYLVSTITHHFQIEVEQTELLEEESNSAATQVESQSYFACEGEIRPQGDRWVIHVRGRASNGDNTLEKRDGAESGNKAAQEFSFECSAFLRIGQATRLAGPNNSPLTVALQLED